MDVYPEGQTPDVTASAAPAKSQTPMWETRGFRSADLSPGPALATAATWAVMQNTGSHFCLPKEKKESMEIASR